MFARFQKVVSEHLIGFAVAAGVLVLTMTDVIADLAEGTSPSHIGIELAIILVATGGSWYFLRQLLRGLRREIVRAESTLERVQAEATRWREQARSHIQGLAMTIGQQFDAWQFTPAEKEVALLIVKGFASKEIAAMRGVAEKTVRLQCSSIYKKSGVNGRAELAAFFLEDLLLPAD